MVFGAILAGGVGTRIGSNIPKQFIDLCGKPIIIHTIERMLAIDEFDNIIIAIHSEYKKYLQNILETFNLSNDSRIIIINGGKERIDSVQNVLNICLELNSNDDDIVVLHDAVRPFVSQRILKDSIKAAREHGACVAAIPATDTIYFHNSDVIVDFPNRAKLCRGQAPDSFKIRVLKDSIESLTESERQIITGTAQICSSKGYPVKIIQGDYKNIKITIESDLLFAKYLLNSGEIK